MCVCVLLVGGVVVVVVVVHLPVCLGENIGDFPGDDPASNVAHSFVQMYLAEMYTKLAAALRRLTQNYKICRNVHEIGCRVAHRLAQNYKMSNGKSKHFHEKRLGNANNLAVRVYAQMKGTV